MQADWLRNRLTINLKCKRSHIFILHIHKASIMLPWRAINWLIRLDISNLYNIYRSRNSYQEVRSHRSKLMILTKVLLGTLVVQLLAAVIRLLPRNWLNVKSIIIEHQELLKKPKFKYVSYIKLQIWERIKKQSSKPIFLVRNGNKKEKMSKYRSWNKHMILNISLKTEQSCSNDQLN